jgi:hypothetical protein
MEPAMSLDAVAADRKVVLMRWLARREAKRLGLEPDDDEIRSMTRWWRRRFGLERIEQFAAWLKPSGMDLPRFMAMMEDFVAVTKVLDTYRDVIDAELPNHHAIHTVYGFVEGRR